MKLEENNIFNTFNELLDKGFDPKTFSISSNIDIDVFNSFQKKFYELDDSSQHHLSSLLICLNNLNSISNKNRLQIILTTLRDDLYIDLTIISNLSKVDIQKIEHFIVNDEILCYEDLFNLSMISMFIYFLLLQKFE